MKAEQITEVPNLLLSYTKLLKNSHLQWRAQRGTAHPPFAGHAGEIGTFVGHLPYTLH